MINKFPQDVVGVTLSVQDLAKQFDRLFFLPAFLRIFLLGDGDVAHNRKCTPA